MAVHSQQSDDVSPTRTPRARPHWLVPGVIIAGLVLAAIVYTAPQSEPEFVATSPEPTPTPLQTTSTSAPVVALVPTATPTMESELILAPTKTPTVELTTAPATPVDLPTVTPTPVITRQPITRTLAISGTAMLRMMVESTTFESSGQPIEVGLPERVFLFSTDSNSAVDSWCVQLGLVNLLFDISMRLNMDTASVITDGQILLRNDFCDAPGSIVDAEEIAMDVPADAAVQLTYTLRGDRNLLAIEGLLDTHTDVLIEFILANRRRASR